MLTLVIPTKFRRQYPELILSYYAEVRFPHKIFLVDSNEDRGPLEKLAGSFKNRLDLHYTSLPGLTGDEAVNAAASQIQTPFAMQAGDDDLVIPQGVDTCLDFLSRHQDYSAVFGETIWTKLFKKGSRIILDLNRVDRGEMSKNIENEKASDRLVSFFKSGGQCTFSVQRSGNFKKKYNQVLSLGFDSRASTFPLTEISLGGLTAIQGKIKRVKGLSLVMIRDHAGVAMNPLKLISTMECVSHAEWAPKMEQMIQLWTNEVISREEIDREEAQYKARIAAYTWMLSKLRMNPFSLGYGSGKKVLLTLLQKGIRNQLERRKKLPLNLLTMASDKNRRYLGFKTCYQKLQQFCEWYNPDLES